MSVCVCVLLSSIIKQYWSAEKVIPAHGQKIVGGWLIGCAGICAGSILLGLWSSYKVSGCDNLL